MIQEDGKLVTAIYRPVGIETNSFETFDDIVTNGFVILYSTQNYDPEYEWDKIVQSLVEEAPDIRSVANIMAIRH